jgi:hypothetical protein
LDGTQATGLGPEHCAQLVQRPRIIEIASADITSPARKMGCDNRVFFSSIKEEYFAKLKVAHLASWAY